MGKETTTAGKPGQSGTSTENKTLLNGNQDSSNQPMESQNPLLTYFKNHKNVALGVCFLGIIFFYSYYSYLQEYL